MDDDDAFESHYMAKLSVMLSEHGVEIRYAKDRAGIDTGLHLFVQGTEGRQATHARVWFQVKGKRATTLSELEFEAAPTIPTQVRVEYVEHWVSAPEPVYLAVYVESADSFIAEDVRDIVERQWPGNEFYAARSALGKSVTLRVDKSCVLDGARLDRMLAHRSMRIDGPSFRGRPLGHRLDPLRSQIDVCEPELFVSLLERILAAHDFRAADASTIGALTFKPGRLYQTLEWQSPAFAEYGFGPGDDFRSEPPLEAAHDHVLIACDSEPGRTDFTAAEREALEQALSSARPDAKVLVVFNAPDLSGTGGTWRSALREIGAFDRAAGVSMIGLEALTFLVLVATLVYLEVVPDLSWRHVNYQG